MSNLETLKSLISIDDEGLDVYIRIGWNTIATISEEDGEWYISFSPTRPPAACRDSKEKAIEYAVNYFKDTP